MKTNTDFKAANLKRMQDKAAKTRARDLFNTYACLSDETLKRAIDGKLAEALDEVQAAAGKMKPLHVWTDGSFNAKAAKAGIGVIIAGDVPKNGRSPYMGALGKPVKADSSVKAELWALSVGLSYLLDTYPGAGCAVVHYDCADATVCAANIDAYTHKGSPYTNLKAVMKRAKKNGVNVIFTHTKAHDKDPFNIRCDLMAKHYSGVKLKPEERRQIEPLVAKAGPAAGRE